MNAHIINIPESHFTTCIRKGYIGVGIVVGSQTPQGLSGACRTSYSMYADMKTIRAGDMIFVHAGNKIFGAFQAKSEFVEDSTAPPQFLSRNLHYKPAPNIPNSGWQAHFLQLRVDDYRRISISHFTDSQSRNISYSKGIDSTEIFDLKYQGKYFPFRKDGDTQMRQEP